MHAKNTVTLLSGDGHAPKWIDRKRLVPRPVFWTQVCGHAAAARVPDESREALRDLVRAREAAKKDQLRARHRLSKFLLRHGRRPPTGVRPWTERHLSWVRHDVHFTPAAQEATLVDYLHEVEHMGERIARLERAIHEAAQAAPPVIEALQALRGVTEMSAVTIVVKVGPLTRLATARQLMGYSGAVPREDSSGTRTRPRGDYQDRECPSSPHHRRGRLGLPLSPGDRSWDTQTLAGPQRRREGHRLEGPAPSERALPKPDGPRKVQATSGDGRRARAPRLHLGNRRRGRGRDRRTTRGLIVEDIWTCEGTQRRRRSRGPRRGASSIDLCDRLSGRTRDASPRQLPTDHDHAARPANIRVINRRDCRLDRHRLCVITTMDTE